MRILHFIYVSQIFADGSRIVLPPLVWQKSTSCWAASGFYRFKLPDCDTLEEGAVIRVIGKRDKRSDEGNLLQKRLIVSSSVLIQPTWYSVQYWHSIVLKEMGRLRRWLLDPVYQTVSYPESSVIEGFVLGTGVTLPEDIKHSIKVMGIAQIMAVSGSHMTLLMGLLAPLAISRKRTINTFNILLILTIYTGLVGWQPAVVRAYLMSAIMIAGKAIVHRQVSFTRSLAVSTILMVVYDPAIVLNVGWQLSVFATLGIGRLYQIMLFALMSVRLPVSERLGLIAAGAEPDAWCLRCVRHVFRLSLEATLGGVAALALIWPILISNFGEWSWGTLLTSVLLWWYFPLVISSCVIGVITIRLLTVALIQQSLVQIISVLLLEWPSRSVVWLLDQTTHLEWLLVEVHQRPVWLFLGWYSLIMGVLIWERVHRSRSLSHRLFHLQPLAGAFIR